jgi:hypothetical protein
LHEFGEAARGVGLKVAELGDELVERLVGEGGCRWVRGKGLEVVAVGWTELKLDVW